MKEVIWSAKRKGVVVLAVLPILIMMVGTGSRAGLVGFLVGMAVFFFPRHGSKKQVIVFLLAAVAVGGVIYLAFRDPIAMERWTRTVEGGDTGRMTIYSTALNMFAERPLMGWGGRQAFEELAVRTGHASGRLNSHNLVLYVLIEVGLIGSIPFLLAIWLCLVAALKSTHTALSLKLFWIILGVSVAASSRGRETKYWLVKAMSFKKPQAVDQLPSDRPLPVRFQR
jgi:O-antigen ligase